MASDKRDRKPNWVSREEIALVQAYIERSDVLEAEFAGCGVGGVSSGLKDRAWTDIREIVNSLASVTRSTDQLKKKIAQIKCAALKKNRTNLTETGGGRGQIMSDAEEMYLNFLKGKNSSSIEGIITGTDFGFLSTSTSTSRLCSPDEEIQPVACGSNDIFSLLERNDCDKKKVTVPLSIPPKSSKSFPKKRKQDEEESSLYCSFLSENIKVMKLKERKLELEIKLLEKNED